MLEPSGPEMKFEAPDFSDTEENPFLGGGLQTRHHAPQLIFSKMRSWIWVSVALVFMLSTVSLAKQNGDLRRKNAWSRGFSTDLAAARVAVEPIQYHFTGGLAVNDAAKLVRVQEPGLAQYVGKPSPAIDAAWEDLMIASEIILTGNEARELEHLTVAEGPDGTEFRLALDVYHTLHCVNEVRKAIDFEYYYDKSSLPYFWRDHVDHCLDYIRQAVQCQSDLTPLTFLPNSRLNTTLPVFGAAHTCRDFSKVHTWAMSKRAMGPAE